MTEQLGSTNKRRTVLVVKGEIRGGGLDRLEMPHASGRDVEGVRAFEAELGGDFHGGGRLEVLARD